MIIAIDGPAGAGKSTVAKTLSEIIGFEYIDTGAMYRAFALKIIKTKSDYKNPNDFENLLNNTNIDFNNNHIILDYMIVDSMIRTEEISKLSSTIATVKEVRLKMVDIQRKIAANKNVILDGRDIGTYVFPEANFKFFLTATPEERGKRRYLDLNKNNCDISLNSIIKEIKARDKTDSTRKFAPLKPANDSIIIDTTNISFNEVIKMMIKIIMEDKDAI